MSSSVSATFSLELPARRWQTASAAAALCICALVPFALRSLPVWGQCAASLLAVSVGVSGLVRAGWLPTRRTVERVARSAMNEWRLEDSRGCVWHTQLQPGTRFFRHFLWLQFESGHRLLLGPQDLTDDDFRRLQVLLRHAPLHERVA